MIAIIRLHIAVGQEKRLRARNSEVTQMSGGAVYVVDGSTMQTGTISTVEALARSIYATFASLAEAYGRALPLAPGPYPRLRSPAI